jgi:uncharacterized protein YabE (DUF348 family)
MRKGIIILVLSLFMALAASLINQNISAVKNVVIDDEGKVVAIITRKNTVKEVLEEQGVHIKDEDEVSPVFETLLERNQKITVKRAMTLTVVADGREIGLSTCADNVDEALKQAGITLNPKDKINSNLDDAVTQDMRLEVTRVSGNINTVLEKIPFRIIKRPSERLEKGRIKVIQKGTEGQVRKQFEIVMHNDKQAFKNLIGEEIINKPLDQIEEYGSMAVYKTSRGESLRFKKVLDMKATAYDLSYESCGKSPSHPQYGITRTGMKAKYGVVAVDPKTIPLKSRLYIEAADGSWVYGNAIAGDTGGGVKGNKIDLFYDDPKFVKRFGIKPVKVYILE